jgi:hypothetical protein
VNETAFWVGLAAALSYYFYVVHKARANYKRKLFSGEQTIGENGKGLGLKGGDEP